MEQLTIKEMTERATTSFIKAEKVPEEIKEKIEGVVMGYVICYEASKQLEKKKEVN